MNCKKPEKKSNILMGIIVTSITVSLIIAILLLV